MYRLSLVLCTVASASRGRRAEEAADPPTWPVTHETVPAYVITLDRTPLRYKLFTTASSAHQVFPKLVKFGAVDGLNIDVPADERISPTGRMGIMQGIRKSHSGLATRGMAGLYISHVDVWRTFLESGAPMGIVFEDDALVQSDAGPDFDGVVASMPDPNEWDVWLLGVVKVLEQRPTSRLFGPGWSRVTNWFGTQAYAITRRGAQRLLAHAYPMTAQIDAYMAHMSALGEVLTVHRSDGKVDFPQFGLLAGTTVQQVYCDTCDIGPSWSKKDDETSWRRTGVAIGMAMGFVPWSAVFAACLAAGAWCTTACRGKCRSRGYAPVSPGSGTSDD